MIVAYKRDLGEFVSSVTTESSHLFSTVADQTTTIFNKTIDIAKNTLEKINDEIDNSSLPDIPLLSKPLFKEQDDSLPLEHAKPNDLDFTLVSFFNDDEFDQYRQNFNLLAKKPEISKLLQDQKFRTAYSHIVPNQLNFQDFWLRFFYKMEVLNKKTEEEVASAENASEKSKVSAEKSIEPNTSNGLENSSVDIKREPSNQTQPSVENQGKGQTHDLTEDKKLANSVKPELVKQPELSAEKDVQTAGTDESDKKHEKLASSDPVDDLLDLADDWNEGINLAELEAAPNLLTENVPPFDNAGHKSPFSEESKLAEISSFKMSDDSTEDNSKSTKTASLDDDLDKALADVDITNVENAGDWSDFE